MELRILNRDIANMVAAGEVVQRPASVVKELMENSVDAGADQVSVIIVDAGRTLIQVIDNGCGMSPDDAVLCFERHATSKIATAEDLQGVLTYGFRGEALASIAAVAKVVLKTRREECETGCCVEFAASEHLRTEETSSPKGTSIAVRDLFYNIPARRKFLKSDNVEFKHIVEEFTKVALTRPETGFALTHNGKEIFVLKPAKSMKYRITDLLGRSVAGDIVDVSADTSMLSARGFAGRPDAARKTLGNQFFFVNGRYFRSPYLHKAVMKAYENMTPEGVTPPYFIYIETDPHSIDVNISPTKSEVKFEDESFVFQVIHSAVKEALGKNSFAGGIDFSNPEAKDMPVVGSTFPEYKSCMAPEVAVDPNYNPFDSDSSAGNLGLPSGDLAFPDRGASWQTGRNGGASGFINSTEDYGKLFEDRSLPIQQTLILGGKYIATPSKDGLMVVNIRRARERLIYDRTLAALTKNVHATQSMMFPVKVEVGAANMTIFSEHSKLLADIGFDIAPFGTGTIVVNGVPEGFSGEAGKVQTMISDLMLVLADGYSSLPELMESAMAEKFAILGSSNSESLVSPMEAKMLVDALMRSSNPEITSNGKKIISTIPIASVDKLF